MFTKGSSIKVHKNEEIHNNSFSGIHEISSTYEYPQTQKFFTSQTKHSPNYQ